MSGLVDKGGALASSGAVQGMRLVRVAYVRRFVT